MKYNIYKIFPSKCLNEKSNFRRIALMRKVYKVLSMTRFDVADRLSSNFGYTTEDSINKAVTLTEDEMEHMAGKIEDALCDGIGFWEALDNYISNCMDIKRVK
jgi:ubiquinone biosynthesis protein UbiJ